jgi:ribose 5-phosphate isomerase B
MTPERIPIAADHAGFEMKARLSRVLRDRGFVVDDKGANSPEATDYPGYAKAVASAVSTGTAKRGVLLCGSGIGMDIVANRYRGVRAALAWNAEIASLSRRHNDSNILVLPARYISEEEGIRMLEAWLTTDFEGGRHQRRVMQIDTGAGPGIAGEPDK